MAGIREKRVLIVDDEEDLTAALALRMSAGWGFAVSVAHDGEEGLRKAAVFMPDVILLDLAMPKVDGWEMCRRLRDDPGTRDIPLVIMTAWVTRGLNERAAAEGACKILLKPFDDEELIGALRAQAGRRRTS
ncbi:MAG: response regulator transcription factor [Elusimicrobiota bacterium]